MSYAVSQEVLAIVAEPETSRAATFNELQFEPRFDPFPRALPQMGLKRSMMLLDLPARASTGSQVYRMAAYSAYDVAFTLNRLSALSVNVLAAEDFCQVDLQLIRDAALTQLEPLTLVQEGTDAEDAFSRLEQRLAVVHMNLLRLG